MRKPGQVPGFSFQAGGQGRQSLKNTCTRW